MPNTLPHPSYGFLLAEEFKVMEGRCAIKFKKENAKLKRKASARKRAWLKKQEEEKQND